MRRLLAAGVVALALVAVPAAGAWTKLTGDTLQNIVDPSVVVTELGTELIAYREPVAGNLKVIRGNNTVTLASGLPFVGDAQILVTGGTLLLYAGEGTGVVPYGSFDDGSSWAAAKPLPGTKTGDVQAAAFLPSGPIFSQDGTDFIDVFNGLTGGLSLNAFPYCCGYAESLAVDSTGYAQIAFWSNATGQSGYLYGPVGGPYVEPDRRQGLALERRARAARRRRARQHLPRLADRLPGRERVHRQHLSRRDVWSTPCASPTRSSSPIRTWRSRSTRRGTSGRSGRRTERSGPRARARTEPTSAPPCT